ncbi:MAG: Arabinose efflux permease [Saliniramus fredricksonii]|uniref:Arabinose efflux permease n=1 Tax=Saliniramus fredricksonii TaxID=1653334 RepID=A0A0P8A6W8_9HYPH|nr:MFS transporter [Saliniramus fredricksonii]KPQ10944.1 MAG: Arabinose efflux permease [Saliniramus fredricksonii]SCC81913.1 Predicted arabinose efflux permease, MFS family [Saliniramus fredricksonii]
MTIQAAVTPTTDPDALAKRNAWVLAGAQALGGANPAIVISIGGLVGLMLAPRESLATLPVSLLNLGLAAGIIPAAMVMRRFGRRNGYIFGGLHGVVGGSIAALAIVWGDFVMFCIGTLIAGFYGSYVQSYRFAATDAATSAFRARAISYVLAGGLAAGILGPQVVIFTRDMVPGATFAGSFMAQALLALIAIVVISFLRTPPVPVTTPAPGDAPTASGRPLVTIMLQPRFIIAVTAGVVSYGLMAFLMTAAPLAMVECGLPLETAALGISWHILAMFAPSFFTGKLIDRYGKEMITAIGLVMIAVSAVIGLSGLTVAHFWTALILLGVGWNFGFIGATALVTDTYRPEERTKAQAANDFIVFGSVAVASFSSGQLLDAGGWEIVNWLSFPPLAVALVLVVAQARMRRHAPA